MNGVFTDRANKVFQLANRAAVRHWHEYIGPEHILLGLIDGHDNNACQVLRFLKIDPADLRKEIEKFIIRGPQPTEEGKRPYTPRAKKLIESAIIEAREMNDDLVCPEHILLGSFHDHETLAYQVLAHHGAKSDAVREAILTLRESPHLIPLVPERPPQVPLPKKSAPLPVAWIVVGMLAVILGLVGYAIYGLPWRTPAPKAGVPKIGVAGTDVAKIREVPVPASSANLDAAIARDGSITFRSWDGEWQGRDADTDIIFRPGGKVFMVEYGVGVQAYRGTYIVDASGETTVRMPGFEKESETTWPVMLLQKDSQSLLLVAKGSSDDFVMGTRGGATIGRNQWTYWPFRPIPHEAEGKMLQKLEALERLEDAKKKDESSEDSATTEEVPRATAPSVDTENPPTEH